MKRAANSHWLGHSTTAARKRARRQVVLADVAITPTTQERYYNGLREVLPLRSQAQSHMDVDESISSSWIQEVFEAGAPLYVVGDALSAISHFEPSLRKCLSKSWRMFSVWRKYEIPARAPPLTKFLVDAMVGFCLRYDWLVFAALLSLGFHALLRTGELLSIRPCDFMFGDSNGVLSLPATKSGTRNNMKESVAILDPTVLELCRQMVMLRNAQNLSHIPCWNSSGTIFRGFFNGLLQRVSLTRFGFKPYSLRRGGATADFQAHGQMERTLVRGRWKSSFVARLYITDALSYIPQITLTPH